MVEVTEKMAVIMEEMIDYEEQVFSELDIVPKNSSENKSEVSEKFTKKVIKEADSEFKDIEKYVDSIGKLIVDAIDKIPEDDINGRNQF